MFYLYMMTHVPSGKVYVGQRKCPEKKTPETDRYFGSGVAWKQIYKAHPDECTKEILHVCETREEVIELEKEYIKRMREQYGNLCVNVSDGGDGALVGGHHPNYGKKLSDEVRKKMSEAHKGIPSWNKGKKYTEEQKKNFKGRTAWNKGKHGIYSQETLKKMSDGQKGKTAWNKGVPRTEEEKRKMSEAKMGKYCGELNPFYGKRHSEETKRRQSIAHSKEHLSPETRRKMSESAKKRKAREKKERERKEGES